MSIFLIITLDKAKRVCGTSNGAHCFFNPEHSNFSDSDNNGGSSSNFIDFGPFIDQVYEIK